MAIRPVQLAPAMGYPLPDSTPRGYNLFIMENNEDAYAKALEYLYSFVDFSLQKTTTYSPARFKLERMVALAASLGNPQQAYPSIHVAGTKGKGSVSAFCAAALRQAGYKVGLYTSPHLDDYAERIQINGEFIPHGALAKLVEEVKPYVAAIPELTTFEITTALAFMYFAQQKVTAAVIEVGLGGRLDATNVILPEVSMITSISYDHTYLLGNTLAEIAGEKAGIIKPDIPVVVSPQEEEAQLVIEHVAHQRGAPFIQVGRDYKFESLSHSFDHQTLRVWSASKKAHTGTKLSIPLLGQHQVVNAATAYAALKTFERRGYKISLVDIQQGFSAVFWPGRFEIIQKSPAVILDCAHNRDSALKLRLTLEEYYPGEKVILLFGASEDKDIQGMLTELMPVIEQLIVVKSYHPRAIEPSKLVEMASPYGKPVQIIDQVPDALEQAIQLGRGDLAVVVTGSIFVVAEARKHMEKVADIRRY